MSSNDLQKLSNELNAEVRWAVEEELNSQVKAFLDARPREFGEYGSKLEEVGHNRKVIAQRIRDDIKRAQKLSASNVDRLPAGLKVSVRGSSRGKSIAVTVKASPVLFENPAHTAVYALRVDKYHCDPDRYTTEGQRIMDVLERIVGQYNYDNSDLMTDYFDVNFYSSIDCRLEKREPLDPELLGDMNVMKLENDPMLGRQLESLNKGRAWAFGRGLTKAW